MKRVEQNILINNSFVTFKPIIYKEHTDQTDETLTSAKKDINVILRTNYVTQISVYANLIRLLSVFFNHGGKLTYTELDTIEKFIINARYNYYNRVEPLHDVGIKNGIFALIKNGFVFGDFFSLHLIVHDEKFTEYIFTDGKCINLEFLENVHSRIVSSSDGLKYTNKLNFLLLTVKIPLVMTVEELSEYSSWRNSNSTIIQCALNTPTIVVTKELINNVAKNCDINTLNLILARGGVMDSQVLESACESEDNIQGALKNKGIKYHKVKFILDNKVEPTKTAFNNLLKNVKNDNFNRRRCRYTKTEIGSLCPYTEELIHLLTEYGYVVSYEDVKNALSASIIIRNIERFNITFDSTYLHICSKVGMYPYNIPKLAPDVVCLANECEKQNNLEQIRKMITEHKIVPDEKCMANACKHKNNISTIKYLATKGGKITFQCVKNMIEENSNRALAYIFEEFEKNYNFELKTELKTQETVNTQSDNKKQTELIPYTKIETDSETNIEAKSETKSEADVKPKIKIEQFVSNIPQNFSHRDVIYEKLPANVKKLLGITIKQKSLNFRDFRKILVDYVKSNELIVDKKINLKEPLLYNGKDTVNIEELNEWAYSICTSKTQIKTKKAKAVPNKTKSSKKKVEPESEIESESESEHEIEPDIESVISTIHDLDDNDVLDENDEEEDNRSAIQKRKERRSLASKTAKVTKETKSKKTKAETKTKSKAKIEIDPKPVTKSKKTVKHKIDSDSELSESEFNSESEEEKPITKIRKSK